jgi:hypothetical protein
MYGKITAIKQITTTRRLKILFDVSLITNSLLTLFLARRYALINSFDIKNKIKTIIPGKAEAFVR